MAANKYERIAPVYDLIDLAELTFKRRLRPGLFAGLSGRILDVGVGTGRNMPFYPAGATVVGLDDSPGMLARAAARRRRLGVAVDLVAGDIRDTGFADDQFDAAVAAFAFGSLGHDMQRPALIELARICRHGAKIRLLDHSLSKRPLQRLYMRLWQPWEKLVYGAGFDRETERHVPDAGLALDSVEFVFGDTVKLISARVA